MKRGFALTKALAATLIFAAVPERGSGRTTPKRHLYGILAGACLAICSVVAFVGGSMTAVAAELALRSLPLPGKVASDVENCSHWACEAGAQGPLHAFASDPARYLFVASRLQTEITLIDSITDDVVGRIGLPGTPSQIVALDRGRWLAVGDTAARQVHLVDVLSGRVDRSISVPVIPEVLRADRTGTKLALLDPRAGSVALMSVASGAARPISEVEGITSVVFEPAGRLLAAGRNGVAIVNAAGHRDAQLTVDPADGPVTEVAVDPGGEYAFAVQAQRGVLSAFDLHNLAPVAVLRLPPPLGRILPSPDSQFLLVPIGGNGVAVVSMWTLKETDRIRASGEVGSVGLALFESVVTIISRRQRRLLLYDLQDRHVIADLRLPGVPEQGAESFDGLKFYVALSESSQIAAVHLAGRLTVHLIDGIGSGVSALVPAVGLSYCH
jgi:DNA-binding beta-propeller fold protein YncE